MDCVYIVTDIEVDGPWPGPNSMRSFASVAINHSGQHLGEFEAVLDPLPGAAPNADTYAWFQIQPEARAATTTDPRPARQVMLDFCQFVKSLPGSRMFAAHPVAFDGLWIDCYLRRLTNHGLTQGPYESDVLFPGGGMCIRSYAAGVTGQPVTEVSPRTLPSEWFGEVEHTHRAIDDARGYANLLTYLLTKAGR